MSEDTWQFDEGDIIRQEHEPHAHGGMPLGKSEYRIERLLIEEGSGDRFYHVETEEHDVHLYASDTIELGYEVISEAESRVWGDA